MECKTKSSSRNCSGMTLVEMLVACGVGAIVLTTVMMFFLFFLRSFAGMGNYVNLNTTSRYALDRMTKDIRQADCLLTYSTNKITLKMGTNNVSYAYDAIGKTVARISGTESNLLLTGCDFLRYDIYQRCPTNGSYDLYPTATATNCKVVQ